MSVTLTVNVKRHTDRAVLIEHDGADIWLPKSQIEGLVPAVGTGSITISDWIAEQKDLISSGEDRYEVDQVMGGAPSRWTVKDMSTNPVHIMCVCTAERDAQIIAASLEMTKNKL